MKFQRFSFSLLLQLKSGTKRDTGRQIIRLHFYWTGQEPQVVLGRLFNPLRIN